ENGKWKMENDNKTKTEIGIEIAVRENNNIGIVAIGNAPTALYRAMKLIRNGIFKPELVIGVPVGFVNAVESKEVLLHMKYPFITSLGRKGGSPIAAAIVNALLKIAEEGGGDR
ncbi:MAG: precorrin-8X methylmutase, partial [Nitrospirota bacterium]